MGNSFNGGPTPNLGHLVGSSLPPDYDMPNLVQCQYSDGTMSQHAFENESDGSEYINVVAIFRCRPKPAPPTEVFQEDLDTDLNF